MKNLYSNFKNTCNGFSDCIVKNVDTAMGRGLVGVYSFLESIIVPVPVEAVMVPMIVAARKGWLAIILIATLGSLIGAMAGYWIGFFFQDFVLQNSDTFQGFISSLGNYKEEVFLISFLGAFTPVIPFKVIVVGGGFLNVAFIPFLIASTLGRFLRFLIVGFCTHLFGGFLLKYVNKDYRTVMSILFLIIIILIIWRGF